MRNGVCNRNRVANAFEEGQIGNIVADVSAFGIAQAEIGDQVLEGGNLVACADENVFYAKLRHTFLDGAGRAPADNRNLDPGIKQLPDSEAVLGVECLAFHAVVRQVKAAIGEDAVDVKRHESQLGQAVVRGCRVHMMPARKRS